MPAADGAIGALRLRVGLALLRLTDLPPAARQQVTAAVGTDVAGVLVDATTVVRALSSDAFASLSNLHEPSADAAMFLGALVLDGVLEVKADGAWRSGPTALDVAPGVPELPPEPPPGSLYALSREALRVVAEGARGAGAAPVASRLYRYNRWVAAPEFSRTWATAEAVLANTEDWATSKLLASDWVPVAPPAGNDRWRIHRHRSAGLGMRRRCKVYISVTPTHLREALAVAVPVLTRLEVPVFKVAADLYGLLRADKFVCYLETEQGVAALASELHRACGDLPAQGVPFTAPWGPGLLLSLGVDPPGGASWRGWVTQRLGAAVAQASEDAEPWAYALRRAVLDGIDTTAWRLA